MVRHRPSSHHLPPERPRARLPAAVVPSPAPPRQIVPPLPRAERSPPPFAAQAEIRDPEADGWERTDFPIVCEDCLGPNPYIRMQREDYAAECAISSRPFTVFRWRPGNEARYKKTVVCREIALAKNVCQVCLLDLDYGIPVQARDAVLGKEREMIAKSDVNLEYQTEQIARRLEEGDEVAIRDQNRAVGKVRAAELLQKMARKKPYYNKNKAPICTFWLRNACNRADCPYRPCNGDTHMPELTSAPELRQQNIKDRYYGINDPVANRMLAKANESKQDLAPPSDESITTLYVGGIDDRVTEDALKDAFYQYGQISSVRTLYAKNCAFVTFVDRAGAEKAAEECGSRKAINGINARIMWGKSKKEKGPAGGVGGGGGGSGGNAGAAGPAMPMMMMPMVNESGEQMMMPVPVPAPMAVPGAERTYDPTKLYPSTDPTAMGTRRKEDEAREKAKAKLDNRPVKETGHYKRREPLRRD